MADMLERERATGSHSIKERKTPLGWVPWVAALLLLALLALTWLLITNVTDENDAAGIDTTDDEVAAGTAGADTGGVDCPSATEVGDQLFTAIDQFATCRIDAVVRVAAVADDNTFTVTDGSRSVVVVDGSKGTVLQPGQRIRMLGTVEIFRFDEASERLELEKSEADYERFEGKTVVLATSTTPA